MIKSFRDLEVYQLSYELAMDIFSLTRNFSMAESYSLTSQMVRSSRSISANIAEGWAKRTYEKKFKVHLIDSLGSATETPNWCSFAKDCNYINSDQYDHLTEKLDHIGRKLTKLHPNWKTRDLPASNHL